MTSTTADLFGEHEGGDRSVYFEDPEGNVVEAWDFSERGPGADERTEALK